VREYINSILDSIDADNKSANAKENYQKAVKEMKEAIENSTSTMMTSFGQGLTTTFRGIS